MGNCKNKSQKYMICVNLHKVENCQCEVIGCYKKKRRFAFILFQNIQIIQKPILLIFHGIC